MSSDLVCTITGLGADGRGVARVGGREIRILGALPGERVRARVEHQSPHRPLAWGRLVELRGAPSPSRVDPSCPHHLRCGGCVLQHLSYPAQLAAKSRRVKEALDAAGVAAAVPPAHAADPTLAYRTRAKYVLFQDETGALGYGSYAPASHEIVGMAGCRVPEAPLDEVAAVAVELLGSTGLSAYDEGTRRGDLRYLVLRRVASGDVQVTVVTRTRDVALAHFAKGLAERRREVASVVHNVNDATGGGIFGDVDVALHGPLALEESLGSLRLRLSPRAFFQVHRAQAWTLYQAAARACAGAQSAVELYAGAGGMSLLVAQGGARVVGVESHPDAVEDARRSARDLGLESLARFVAARAEDHPLEGADAVIVDPPKKGLDPAVRRALVDARPPRVVYVSCGPESLARDLAELTGSGYSLASVECFDMMPGTPEVETLAVLQR